MYANLRKIFIKCLPSIRKCCANSAQLSSAWRSWAVSQLDADIVETKDAFPVQIKSHRAQSVFVRPNWPWWVFARSPVRSFLIPCGYDCTRLHRTIISCAEQTASLMRRFISFLFYFVYCGKSDISVARRNQCKICALSTRCNYVIRLFSSDFFFSLLLRKLQSIHFSCCMRILCRKGREIVCWKRNEKFTLMTE